MNKTFYRLVCGILTPSQRCSFRWIVFWMVVSSFFESLGLSLIIPYVGILSGNASLLQWIGNTLPFPLDISSLTLLISALFFGMITLKGILQMYVSWLSSRFPYMVYQSISTNNYNAYMRQSYLEYAQGTVGSYVRNCTHAVEQAASGVLFYLRYLSGVITTVFLFALLFFENMIVSGLLVLLFSSLAWLIHGVSKRPQLESGREKEAAIEKLYQWIHDTFLLFKEIRLYKYESRFLKGFEEQTKRLTNAYKGSAFYPGLPQIYVEWFAVSLLLGIVVIYVVRGHPVAEIVAPLLFYAAVGRRLLPILTQTIAFKIQMQHFRPAIEELAVASEGVLEKPIQSTPAPFTHSIRLCNIHFSYDPNREVLRGVDLEILKNQSIAIVGPSGAGKSTLVKILMGLVSPSQGKILVDEQESRAVRAMGYVPQDIALLTGTIVENIVLFENPIHEERLERAIKMSQLDRFVSSLPLGLQTPVGERGMALSGGQKQRLAIARALYQDPEILLFDEATSSLDNVSEALIAETIEAMSGKKTIIAIAHRLSTIQGFDRIYVLNEGKMVALGTHKSLLETSELYRNLLRIHS